MKIIYECKRLNKERAGFMNEYEAVIEGEEFRLRHEWDPETNDYCKATEGEYTYHWLKEKPPFKATHRICYANTATAPDDVMIVKGKCYTIHHWENDSDPGYTLRPDGVFIFENGFPLSGKVYELEEGDEGDRKND